jgi:hypothetical protein
MVCESTTLFACISTTCAATRALPLTPLGWDLPEQRGMNLSDGENEFPDNEQPTKQAKPKVDREAAPPPWTASVASMDLPKEE